jgi:hypothetical protein
MSKSNLQQKVKLRHETKAELNLLGASEQEFASKIERLMDELGDTVSPRYFVLSGAAVELTAEQIEKIRCVETLRTKLQLLPLARARCIKRLATLDEEIAEAVETETQVLRKLASEQLETVRRSVAAEVGSRELPEHRQTKIIRELVNDSTPAKALHVMMFLQSDPLSAARQLIAVRALLTDVKTAAQPTSNAK